MVTERREPTAVARSTGQPGYREEPVHRAKPFVISKQEIWQAYKKVKANRGAAGVDRQTMEEFERDLKGNLYKLWNRMSSGSYFPPPVLRVEIPKATGGKRPLGIPTVADRVAQQVVKQRLEPELEPHFHNNSYGYRPGKSAHDALSVTRMRCWEYDWVLDVDIKGFFDNIDHELLMSAVRKHVQCRWMLLYLRRWLEAPVQLEDGTVQERTKGTPQGGVISPLLANLFLHYAFDMWMVRNARNVRFERYADDIVCHCQSLAQAEAIKRRLAQRMWRCGLELHPEKTQIAYCRDQRRTESYHRYSFDFLGYTFKPRKVKRGEGHYETGFGPAISAKAQKRIWTCLREWGFRRKVRLSVDQMARIWNPVLQGWLQYYGRFHRSVLYRVLGRFDARLAQWATSKYNRTRARLNRGHAWLQCLRQRSPYLFAHWRFFAAEL